MSLTPKQQLEQVNNPNLLSILSTIQGLPSQESLKQGAYVWKKLTAEGGDFIDFVVSDNATAYPDGAVHTDGYWYEKSGGGCKTYTGSITLASPVNSIEIANPLGNKDNVKAVFLSCFNSNPLTRSDTVYYNIDTDTSFLATYAGRSKDVELTITNDNITIKNTSYNFDNSTYNWEVIGNE